MLSIEMDGFVIRMTTLAARKDGGIAPPWGASFGFERCRSRFGSPQTPPQS
ncbi:MAG TPA: hypothetical protein VGL53_24035 [Bryobacteraceae bacterium]